MSSGYTTPAAIISSCSVSFKSRSYIGNARHYCALRSSRSRKYVRQGLPNTLELLALASSFFFLNGSSPARTHFTP